MLQRLLMRAPPPFRCRNGPVMKDESLMGRTHNGAISGKKRDYFELKTTQSFSSQPHASATQISATKRTSGMIFSNAASIDSATIAFTWSAMASLASMITSSWKVFTIRVSTPCSPREMCHRTSLKVSAQFVWTGRQNRVESGAGIIWNMNPPAEPYYVSPFIFGSQALI